MLPPVASQSIGRREKEFGQQGIWRIRRVRPNTTMGPSVISLERRALSPAVFRE
jgi:hypothetical protein